MQTDNKKKGSLQELNNLPGNELVRSCAWISRAEKKTPTLTVLDLCPGKERDAGFGDAGDTSDTASVGQGSWRCRRAAGMAEQLQKEHRWCEPQP